MNNPVYSTTDSSTGGFQAWRQRSLGLDTATFWSITTADEQWLCDVSFSYFLLDTAFDFMKDFTVVMTLHHVCTLGCIYVLRFATPRGGLVMCLNLMLAELTNTIQVPWTTSKILGYTSLHHALSLPLTAAYILIRGVVFPVFFYFYVTATYVAEEAVVATWQVHVTTVCIVGVVLGSFVWTYDLVVGYRKYAAKQRGKRD